MFTTTKLKSSGRCHKTLIFSFFFLLKNEYQYDTLSLPEKRQITHILPSVDKPMESLASSYQSPASARVS